MHTAEVALGRFIALMHCTPESFEKLKKQDPDYPGWKTNDKSELNYLAWHLQHTVPKSAAGKPGEDVHTGWNSFALARRRPLLMDRALFEYHRQQILRVPPENRKLSKEILQQAHQAWQAGRKEQSDSLYRRAMTINPACYDAYRHFGNRYETWGKFTEAVAYMQKYISFTQDSNYCYRAGSILASRLGRYAEAEALFSLGIRSLGNDNRRKAQLCVRATLVLLQAGQYRPARTIALQGVGLDPASKTLECEFLAGECAFRSGDKQAGLAEIRSALNKGLRNNSWYAHRLKRWSWGLLNAGNLPDALALAEAGSLVADAGCRNQCIFQKGESLFKLGHKEEGMRLMRSVLEPLGKWWQQRFVRVTGRR
mgnify:CR=1 FL=1